MYRTRKQLYQTLEQERQSKLLVYVTGDRLGLEAQIHQEVLDFLVGHLDKINSANKISLYLYTRGGSTLAAWSIVNLLNQFCNEFEVIIPSKAHSAGTLICLGANNLVMTKQATLGPIDPSVNTPLNPEVPGAPPPNNRMPVSVEAINGFLELAKSQGINKGEDLVTILTTLAAHVHPLVLGDVYRTRSQIRMLGERLLSRHINDKEKIEKILGFLCSESGSHDYTIYRQEAKNNLGLNVENPSDSLYNMIKDIYDDIASELELTQPYNPAILLGEQPQKQYKFNRAIIESIEGGSDVFLSEGTIIKRNINVPNQGIQIAFEDQRMFEGWKHEEA